VCGLHIPCECIGDKLETFVVHVSFFTAIMRQIMISILPKACRNWFSKSISKGNWYAPLPDTHPSGPHHLTPPIFTKLPLSHSFNYLIRLLYYLYNSFIYLIHLFYLITIYLSLFSLYLFSLLSHFQAKLDFIPQNQLENSV